MNPTVSSIVAVLSIFFAKNPTVQEIIDIVEQVAPALSAAQQGQAFSVAFPESIDGKAGTTTVAWAPTATVSTSGVAHTSV